MRPFPDIFFALVGPVQGASVYPFDSTEASSSVAQLCTSMTSSSPRAVQQAMERSHVDTTMAQLYSYLAPMSRELLKVTRMNGNPTLKQNAKTLLICRFYDGFLGVGVTL